MTVLYEKYKKILLYFNIFLVSFIYILFYNPSPIHCAYLLLLKLSIELFASFPSGV